MRGGAAPRGGVAPRLGHASNFADKPKLAQKRIACKFLKLSGFCERGNECRFAHDQLKKNLAKKTIISHKDELCLNYQEGNCKYQDRCNYAHGEHELTDKIECNPLYKTTMCKSGPECQKNENCAFAHDETELRSVTTQDLAKLKKNVPCTNLEIGYCPQGDTCPYKHDNQQQGQFNKQYQQETPKDGFISIQQMIDMFDYDPSKPNFRTTLCKNWLEKKDCTFGNRCNHAHKEADMKALPESEPGYKDTLCKYIEEETDCKWADKCKFAHGLKELMKYTKMRPGMNKSQCKSFVERKCLYGINCSFQHIIPGEKLDWKVSRCKNGEDCKFGMKCAYAHNDAEIRTRDENAEHIELRNNIETVHKWKQMGCNIQQMFSNLLEQSKVMMQGAGPVMNQQTNNMMTSDDMMNEMMNNATNMITSNINQQIGGGTNMINKMMNYNMNDADIMDIMPRSNPSLPLGNSSVMAMPSVNSATSQGLIGGKKAELCPIWLDEGSCTRCSCVYAHGHKELSQLQALAVMKRAEMTNPMPMGAHNRSMGVVGAANMSNVSIGAGNMGMAAGNRGMTAGNMGMGPSTSRPVCPFPDVDEPPELDGKYKVVMCEFNNDNCLKGPRCYFAHSYAELHYYRAKQVPNYKRSLCKSWEEGGNCQWNKTCMFAHGSNELRGMDIDMRSC